MLFGAFCIKSIIPNLAGANEPAKWKCTSLMESCEDLMPDFDFLAPEYAAEDDDILSPATDMFSLGMLAFTLHNSKPLFTNSGSWNNYRRNCTEVNDVFKNIFFFLRNI